MSVSNKLPITRQNGLFMRFLAKQGRRCDYLARFRAVTGCLLGALRSPISSGYPDDGTGFDGPERGVHFVHQQREVIASVALRAQQQDREVEAPDVLLVRDALVRAYEHVEPFFGQPQQLAVFLSGPAGIGHRGDFVSFGKLLLQPTVHVLVQEYAQLKLLDPWPDYRPAAAARSLSAESRVVSR